MGQNWAIAIGINQYENLPDLNYAKEDGKSIQHFFTKEAEFQQVYLFTLFPSYPPEFSLEASLFFDSLLLRFSAD